jgi:hypothetical protein
MLDDADLDHDGMIIHALTGLSILGPERAFPDQLKPFLERHDLD